MFDANLLAKIWIADLFLKIAENTGWVEPVWTEQILEETYRAQTVRVKHPWSENSSRYFLSELRRSFPASMVSGHEKWISQCTNDEGDRHVLACAIRAKAVIILTYNERHFRPEHLEPWGIRQMHPQDYLEALFAKESAGQAPLYLRVAQWYRESKYAVIDVPHVGLVKLEERAVIRSIRHSRRLNRPKVVGFAAVPAVLMQGRILYSEPLRGSKDEGRVHYVAAPITIVGVGFIVVVMVKKDRHGARMYLHCVLAKEKLRHSAHTSGGDQPEGLASDTQLAEKAGVVWTLLSGLYAVNREGACGTSTHLATG